MKQIVPVVFMLVLFCSGVMAQANCSAPATGFVPINDLGKGVFINAWNVPWQGGLYPDGSNFIPAAHKNAGLQIASRVKALDANGNGDSQNGKIVWLSIGMSNTTQETQQFISLGNAYVNKNPRLVLVDGAQGGMTAAIISTASNANYAVFWTTVANRLAAAGVTSRQVQVIWLKEADVAGTTPVKAYYDSLVVRHKRILYELKLRFPNVSLCYLSGRISARYAASTLNPEPYAYYSGWAVKRVIEDQINGDKQLQFSGAAANSPWIAWGAYMWSDGSSPQLTNPSVFWTCPTDFQSDGTHPSSPAGARKAGTLLLNFFTSDSTTASWFLKSGLSHAFLSENTGKPGFHLFPNPFINEATLQTDHNLTDATVAISNLTGQTLRKTNNINGCELRVQRNGLPAGIYFLNVTEEKKLVGRIKIVVTD